MGAGRGFGSREGGPGSGGDGIPEHERWIINYEASDIGDYAKQLSFFNIDIAVVHKTKNDVWRVHDVGKRASVIKSNRKNENKTLMFGHKKMRMQRWDQELCKRAGVELSDTAQWQFYPEETRVIVRTVEAAYLQEIGKSLAEVKNTVLKIEPDGRGYKFTVLDMTFR